MTGKLSRFLDRLDARERQVRAQDARTDREPGLEDDNARYWRREVERHEDRICELINANVDLGDELTALREATEYVVSADQASNVEIEHTRRPAEPGFHEQCYPLCLRCTPDALARAVKGEQS